MWWRRRDIVSNLHYSRYYQDIVLVVLYRTLGRLQRFLHELVALVGSQKIKPASNAFLVKLDDEQMARALPY